VASLPEELRGLLLRRIEALPPTTRQVLEAASVVGETFAVAAVAAGARRPVQDIETVCTGLAAHRHFLDDAGWTVWPDATSGGQYRLQHALYHQVLYEALGMAQRVQMHQRIGARLEGRWAMGHERGRWAEAYGQAGQAETGLQILTEVLTLVAATEERWWEGELYRLQGELLLQLPIPDVGQAEDCFRQALDVARRQQAKAWELGAALSLGRLWQGQEKRAAPRQLLVESYCCFTEGFDTADLQEAKALLAELEVKEP
jgi:hypothetical protein